MPPLETASLLRSVSWQLCEEVQGAYGNLTEYVSVSTDVGTLVYWSSFMSAAYYV